PGRTLGGAGVALAVALGVGWMLPRDLLPDVDQGTFEARIRLPEGAGLASTADAAAELERVLRAAPAVDVVLSRIGRDLRAYGEGEDRPDLNSALLQVRVAGAPTTEVLERIRPAAARIPDARVTLETGRATTLGRIVGGEIADVAVRIRG